MFLPGVLSACLPIYAARVTDSLAVLADDWLRAREVPGPSPATVRAWKGDLAVMAEIIVTSVGRSLPASSPDLMSRWMGVLTPADLTADVVVAAFATYGANHAPASLRRCRSTWASFCRWMVSANVLNSNPVDFVPAPRTAHWRPRPLSPDDLTKVVAAAQTPSAGARHPWPELERALCALFVGAGLRVSEAMRARVKDLRSDPPGALSVVAKGGVIRVVPIDADLHRVIDDYLESRRRRLGSFADEDWLLVRSNGEGLTPKVVDHLVAGWFKRADVPRPKGALAQSLRYSYVTIVESESVPTSTVDDLLTSPTAGDHSVGRPQSSASTP